MTRTAKRIADQFASVLLAVALAACAPSPADGLLACNPTGKACPDGYYCANDGTCWRTGHAPDLSAGGDMPAPDLGYDTVDVLRAAGCSDAEIAAATAKRR